MKNKPHKIRVIKLETKKIEKTHYEHAITAQKKCLKHCVS